MVSSTKNENFVINYSPSCRSKQVSSASEHKLRYFWRNPRAFWYSIDSNATTMFKAQKGSKDIVKTIINYFNDVHTTFLGLECFSCNKIRMHYILNIVIVWDLRAAASASMHILSCGFMVKCPSDAHFGILPHKIYFTYCFSPTIARRSDSNISYSPANSPVHSWIILTDS